MKINGILYKHLYISIILIYMSPTHPLSRTGIMQHLCWIFRNTQKSLIFDGIEGRVTLRHSVNTSNLQHAWCKTKHTRQNSYVCRNNLNLNSHFILFLFVCAFTCRNLEHPPHWPHWLHDRIWACSSAAPGSKKA